MAVQISGNDITVPRDTTVTRNLTVGGVLTYEDVTNVDSVGLVTARSGIEIGARPGVAASISVDGNMIVSGISTFGGDVQVPDKIIHAGDTNTAIRFPTADTVTVETAGSERIRINDNGKLLIATDTTSEAHANQDELIIGKTTDDANHGLTIVTPDDRYGTVAFSDGSGGNSQGLLEYNHSGDYMRIYTAASERLRVDSNGRILQGSSTGRNTALMAAQATYQLEGVGSNASNFSIFCNSNGTAAGGIEFGKTRGTSTGGTTVVASGDDLGHISFEGSDGSAQRVAARINVQVDGTPGSSDMPGRIRFLTTPDGSATEVERLRIESDGDFRLSSGDAGTNYGYIRGWESSTGNMIIGADQSTTGSSGSNLIFRTRGGERARIIHGGGITFNGDTAAANALDDYEEGTWTPSIHNGGSPSYSQQAGLYTKIGNLVTHVFVVAYSGASSSSSTRIQGLPFAYSSTFETTTNLGRIGAAWNDAESAGSRALHAVGHTGTGTSMIYVDLLTSGTDKTLRGFFQMRV